MRDAKIAIIKALAADPAVHALAAACYTVERAAVPQLPSIEAIAVSSERVGNGPMVRHLIDLECTVSHATEDGADEQLDALVQAVRARLDEAENATRPIPALADGQTAVCELQATRWSISASGGTGVVRGARVSLSCEVAE